MSDALSNFFAAWQMQSADERYKAISSVVTPDIQYDDPRTPETITSTQALSDYVGMFSENAPGWVAEVVSSSSTAGMTRVNVAFRGQGPDGTEMTQPGQYFAEFKGDLICRMVGFAGTGEGG